MKTLGNLFFTFCFFFSPTYAMAIPLSEARVVHQKIERIFRPIFGAQDMSFEVKFNFDRTYTHPNATAELIGRQATVHVSEKVSSPLITNDGYILMICHEIGHILGGAPKQWYVEKSGPGPVVPVQSYLSYEGQSDYYSTLKCAKIYWSADLAENGIDWTSFDRVEGSRCTEFYESEKDIYICERSLSASLSQAKFIAKINGEEAIPSIYTPSFVEVQKSKSEPNDAQCRLDTFVAGAYCSVDPEVSVDNSDARIGTCTTGPGKRPRCWHKPYGEI